jgi:hypothetical protein
VTLTVIRSDGDLGIATVEYETVDGTATAGSDYSTRTGRLTWQAGETGPKTFTVPILTDNAVEGSETFGVVLGSPTGGVTIGSRNPATITITDVVNSGVLRFQSATAEIGERGGTVNLSVVRDNGNDGRVCATCSSANGTATAGSDYNALTSTICWEPGDTASKQCPVTIRNDDALEGTETFSVALSNPTGGATIGTPATVTVSIVDDDTIQAVEDAVQTSFGGPITIFPTANDAGESLEVVSATDPPHGTAVVNSDDSIT